MPPLENERCPEGGPELQVTRTGPGPEPAAHPLRSPAPRPDAPARGCAQGWRGASRGLGSRIGARAQGGGARSAPAWRALTLPAGRAATFRLLFPGAARGGGCGERGARGGRRMPQKMEKFLQIAPHSLAIILGPAEGPAGERSRAAQPAPPNQPRQLARHHIGYEIFADFKAENMQHFWNKKVTAAVAETFFLGWIDEQVLLIQGKEEHLEALREGWTRRALRPPSGFHIRCLGESGRPPPPPRPARDPRPALSRCRRREGAGAQAPLPRALCASLHRRAWPGEGPAAACERGIGELPGTEHGHLYLSPAGPPEPPWRRGRRVLAGRCLGLAR